MHTQDPDTTAKTETSESRDEAIEQEPRSVPEIESPSALESEPDSSLIDQPFIDGQEHSVDPASIIAARLVGMIVVVSLACLVLIALTVAWALGGLPASVYRVLLVVVGLPALGFACFAWQWPAVHHRHLSYRVDTEGVRIRRGVVWRKVISIPTTRVQHTDVSQGPLQRNFDLATLTVHTAGTAGASIPLDGLNHQIALRLRDHLLPAQADGN